MTCPCGMRMNTTTSHPYQFARYNAKNEVVYAICFHGYVVIDIENLGRCECEMPVCILKDLEHCARCNKLLPNISLNKKIDTRNLIKDADLRGEV